MAAAPLQLQLVPGAPGHTYALLKPAPASLLHPLVDQLPKYGPNTAAP